MGRPASTSSVAGIWIDVRVEEGIGMISAVVEAKKSVCVCVFGIGASPCPESFSERTEDFFPRSRLPKKTWLRPGLTDEGRVMR